MEEKNLKDIIYTLILVVYSVVFIGIIPIYLLLGFAGIEIELALDKVQLYYGLAIFGLAGLIAGKIAQMISRSSKKAYEKIGWLGSFIHNPDDGFLPTIEKGFEKPIAWIRKPGKLALISFIFFSLFALMGVFANIWFTGLPEEFQVTETAKLGLAVNPASDAETFAFVFLIGLCFFALKYFFKKNKYPMWLFWTLIFLVVIPLLGFGGMGYHVWRYGSDVVTLTQVFIFFTLGGVITVLTGSLIPFMIWHQTNNFFQKATELFSSDTMIVFTLLFFMFLIIFTILYFIVRKNRKDG